MQPAKIPFAVWRSVCSLPIRVVVSVRAHGFQAACRRGWRRARETAREWQLGIRTAGSIDATSLDTGADRFGYQPIPYAAFAMALQTIQAGANDVFVDLGCGLGRAVILAGMGPFQRVVGVEISPQLCALARRNVCRARRRLQASKVDIVEADAAEYTLPDDATVLLLFNPFDEPVVRRVLENARQSLARRRRGLTIIYAIPKARPDALASTPWLRLDRTLDIPDEAWLRLAIYRNTRDV